MTQVAISDKAVANHAALDAARRDGTHKAAPDLAYRRLGLVNVVFVGEPGAGDRCCLQLFLNLFYNQLVGRGY
jgi:hypothetical protein